MTWEDFESNLVPGAVIIDNKHLLPDGSIKQKWLLILSNIISSKDYLYCLTTSKASTTYKYSFTDHVVSNDFALGKKCIIELELMDLIDVKVLELKYKKNELTYKGKVSPLLLSEVNEKIQDSERIIEYYKKLLGL